MGGYKNIRHGNQTNKLVILYDVSGEILVEQVALFFVNIQTCGADFLLLDSGNLIFCVDQSAPGGVDNGYSFFHQRDRI